jgi:hypothetical protein
MSQLGVCVFFVRAFVNALNSRSVNHTVLAVVLHNRCMCGYLYRLICWSYRVVQGSELNAVVVQ